ncbi:hypothetical protein L484_012677 [Morus notabilis]|uniref:Uncharacterized protein n=1 Tax=Morus notabilis TaxID=981085 RepID=W9QD60_9ROSA|nr:hypothetical protein L484_012677 [Morus notabilis]
MLRPDIALIVDNGITLPTTTTECVKGALRAEYHLNKRREEQAHQNEASKSHNNQHANVLFDTGATHSFVSSSFAKRIG